MESPARKDNNTFHLQPFILYKALSDSMTSCELHNNSVSLAEFIILNVQLRKMRLKEDK
jgi:hypothetical protein